jgi:hypothetical protein
MGLKEYTKKRRSGRSPEPGARRRPMSGQPESVLSGRTLDELS